MAAPKKYTFDNGVMKINPEYTTWKAAQSGKPAAKKKGKPVPTSQLPLAIISSMGDVADASLVQYESTGTSLELSESTVASLEIMQEEEYTEEFKQPGGGLEGGELLEGLTNYFVKFEVPVGLLNKLMALQAYNLSFIIDDSGSMTCKTDSPLGEASEFVLRTKELVKKALKPAKRMTRWQEAETRLHNLMDILAFIPIKTIHILFMNAPNTIELERTGKTIDGFTSLAHAEIAQTFSLVQVRYRTPTLSVMSKAFQAAKSSDFPTMHYLFTDGVPTDGSASEVADLIRNRKNPERNPVTFISCTDQDSDTEWMKQVEEVAPFCSEIDDYEDEKREVAKDQGIAFPYTKGYWLVSQLVAAINPHDLDAIDENIPFTKHTLDNLLGRVHSETEYKYYFDRNPHKNRYLNVYSRFSTEAAFARDIITSKGGQHGVVPVSPAVAYLQKNF